MVVAGLRNAGGWEVKGLFWCMGGISGAMQGLLSRWDCAAQLPMMMECCNAP